MSELRKQIDAARAQYQTTRYPGNLAHEMLPIPFNYRRAAFIGAASAIAAAVIIAFVLHWSAPVARNTIALQPTKKTVAQSTTGELLAFPTQIQLVPKYQTITIPSMPAFPSWSASVQTTSSTTQEAL